MKTVAIITAGGSGRRMGGPKQFLEIAGKPMLEHTLAVFENCGVINEIILVVSQADLIRARRLKFSKLKEVAVGGPTRQDSVFNGLKVLPEDADLVAIHDGARPLVTEQIIERAVAAAIESGAVVAGVPVKDTIKMTNDGHFIKTTLNRQLLWLAQTPQVFKKDIIVRAYNELASKEAVTDDSMLVEKMGLPVTMVMGSDQNIKITTPVDLKAAKGVING